jgi:hypothetical protein
MILEDCDVFLEGGSFFQVLWWFWRIVMIFRAGGSFFRFCDNSGGLWQISGPGQSNLKDYGEK